ncbi:hypothetical protein V2I01_35865 [Micromonospora sp. BRA006-A]|nr:hypothetical protein [Micromonospora sp. BRA006-A]
MLRTDPPDGYASISSSTSRTWVFPPTRPGTGGCWTRRCCRSTA